jgi:hypothetical protein
VTKAPRRSGRRSRRALEPVGEDAAIVADSIAGTGTARAV